MSVDLKDEKLRQQICEEVSSWVRRVVKEMIPLLLDSRQQPNDVLRVCLWEEFHTVTVQLFVRVKPHDHTDVSTAGRLVREKTGTFWHHCYWDQETDGPKIENSSGAPDLQFTLNAERDDEHPKP